MKQISLAMHNYHDAHVTFPPGYISIMGIQGNEQENEWGWGAFLLPYLDQTPLFNQIDFSTSVAGGTVVEDLNYTQSTIAKTSNAATAQTMVPPYLCILDDLEVQKSKQKAILGYSSYSGLIGINWDDLPCATVIRKWGQTSLELTAEPCQSNDGVFHLNSRVRQKDIRDGTSHTIFIAETSNRLDFPIQALAPDRADGPLLWGGTYWASVLNPLAQDHVLTATVAGINNPDESGFSPGINSRHSGGANVAFIDGSVRKLSDDIDSNPEAPYGVLQRLSTIAGGEPVIEF